MFDQLVEMYSMKVTTETKLAHQELKYWEFLLFMLKQRKVILYISLVIRLALSKHLSRMIENKVIYDEVYFNNGAIAVNQSI